MASPIDIPGNPDSIWEEFSVIFYKNQDSFTSLKNFPYGNADRQAGGGSDLGGFQGEVGGRSGGA
jgi:hypothetical protein